MGLPCVMIHQKKPRATAVTGWVGVTFEIMGHVEDVLVFNGGIDVRCRSCSAS